MPLSRLSKVSRAASGGSSLPARTRRTRRRAVFVTAAMIVAMGVGTTTAGAAAPDDGATPAKPATTAKGAPSGAALAKVSSRVRLDHAARQTVFVEFAGGGAADAAESVSAQGKSKQRTVANQRKAALRNQTSAVLSEARSYDGKARALWSTTNSVPGVAMDLDQAGIAALAQRSDVTSISALVPKTVENASAAELTKVIDTWQNTGNTGKGVKVGIIDTGIDYTHADFGGPGTVAAYQAAHANSAGPWTPTAKVVGGYDFAGDNYDADPNNPTYQPIPHPDSNPLDCEGHGTHVAGTVAGYGVNADGTTYQGNYKSLTASVLDSMKVGPGMAPQASLYALKVFGCTGSTDLVIPALDWALDPNGDGDFSDHLDIVNLSLGSDYGAADDPENAVIDNLAKHGVLPVIAMGNGGDYTDIGGSPGNAVRSLAVANSVDQREYYDGLIVDSPAGVGIQTGQQSVAYDWVNGPEVTGDVVAIPGSDADGCAPLSATDAAKVAGKVAWLEWDDNDATRRCGSAARSKNASDAGAIGAIFTSTLQSFQAGITGSAIIPVFQLTGPSTDTLRPMLAGATPLTVTFTNRYHATQVVNLPGQTDTLNTSSSRGTHGAIGVVKPDVAAPGTTIASAGVGTGNDRAVESGTSMATPHVAGIAALVKVAHPGWTAEQLKAAIMNTAGHDVWTGDNLTGNRYGPARVGAGRVDALAAVSTSVLAYSSSTPGAVSASFGVVPVDTNRVSTTRTTRIRVQNTGSRTANVTLSYEGIVSEPGVSYSVWPRTARIPARGSITATVTMTVLPRSLRHTIDPTMETDELGVPRQYLSDASGRILISQTGKADLRVPVYGAAKPVSTTTARAGKVAGNPAIVLRGNGFAQGSGSTAFTSLASVMQLGITSGKMPKCTTRITTNCVPFGSQRSGDIQYVGAGSIPSGSGYADGWLYFGVSTYGNWATVGTTALPWVEYDVNGDGKYDYQTYAQPLQGSDVYVAVTQDLRTGDTVDIEPLNFNWGDVDTNLFDNNVVVMPVLPSAIGVTDGLQSFPITYRAGSTSAYVGDLDVTGTAGFDVVNPGVSTDEPLYQDQGNTAIGYTLGSSTTKKGTTALVLHLHGADGKRAELVKLPGSKR